LRCDWWSNGFQLHLVCQTQNCVVTGGALAFRHLVCETQICVVRGGASAFNYTWCAKNRIALSLVEHRLSITLGVRNTELRCHWWSNGYQLYLVCEAQNCVFTGVATAFNYTCAKHRITLSLVEQQLSITLVLAQNCVVTSGKTAFN